MNIYTLTFKNKQYENEWIIQEINDSKILVFMVLILKIIGDFIWTFGKASLPNQI